MDEYKCFDQKIDEKTKFCKNVLSYNIALFYSTLVIGIFVIIEYCEVASTLYSMLAYPCPLVMNALFCSNN